MEKSTTTFARATGSVSQYAMAVVSMNLSLSEARGVPLERPHGQGVLDDLVVAARLADLAPELGDRGHGDAAEVDEDRVLRLREVAAKRLDERFFFLPLECH